ncbi:MAG: hypothetical protein KBB88_02940 [Candidatus Pacebacteria bacterium]|nr:hypothetical protein [Candidatus Paceibacterota bacterium]
MKIEYIQSPHRIAKCLMLVELEVKPTEMSLNGNYISINYGEYPYQENVALKSYFTNILLYKKTLFDLFHEYPGHFESIMKEANEKGFRVEKTFIAESLGRGWMVFFPENIRHFADSLSDENILSEYERVCTISEFEEYALHYVRRIDIFQGKIFISIWNALIQRKHSKFCSLVIKELIQMKKKNDSIYEDFNEVINFS